MEEISFVLRLSFEVANAAVADPFDVFTRIKWQRFAARARQER
jgi:hypothetical protein